MTERKQLTDEEWDRRCAILEKIDELLREATSIMQVSGYFNRVERLWFESFAREQFDVWHDAILATWNYDHDNNPNAE